MSKVCPKGGTMLYTDCKECDDKICKLSKKERYFRHIDMIMFKRGYERVKTCKDYCIYKTISKNVWYNSIYVKVCSKKRYKFITTVASDTFENIENYFDFWDNITTLYV